MWKNTKLFRDVFIGVILLATGILAAANLRAQEKPRKGTLQWYINGPQKTWTENEYKDYYKWRENRYQKLFKANRDPQLYDRHKTIMNGNKITAEVWNYGSISSPGNRVTDIVWEGLGYGYEFAPFICAEVPVPKGSHIDAYMKLDENGNPVVNAQGDTVWAARVISDALVSLGGEVSPDGSEFWGWEPLISSDDGSIPYVDPLSGLIATSNDIDKDGDGKPDSWPEGWYNPNLKQYVWPGALKQGATNADIEAFFVIDDRNNKEFDYYPFPNDSSRRGLGLEVECRYYQWSNPLAEDMIFLIYKVTNKSEKDLHQVVFGMWGDPHIGGPSNWDDDLAFFDRDLNMVYAWDEDDVSDVAGKKPGYFGFKFLESPGNPHDGIDNDNDGMIDESRTNGIDDDNDWNPEKDDVGLDGLPNTGDEGEGDGIPTAGDQFDIRKPGEPNFEWTDLDESDMIGLTSFAAPPYTSQNRISNDHYIYTNFLVPDHFDTANSTQAGDNIFLYGSGAFTLKAGESRRFSIALVIGQNYDDLILNAQTAQDIYEINYQFAKPPEKPTVTAVPGDRRVTLYWDDVAEQSVDPISEKKDFEGYVIYRSLDPQFLDKQTITDANGSKFLFDPLKTVSGASAKFDLANGIRGLSPIVYSGRGVAYNLGNDTGLRHSFVDSNNVLNGQTYYYAVVSYDHGDEELQIAPTECSKSIAVDPETNTVTLDVNTVQVVPRSAAAGFKPGRLQETGSSGNIFHKSGYATGSLKIEIIDPRKMEEGNEFEVLFLESPTRYTVQDLTPVQESFTANIDKFYRLEKSNINDSTFVLTDANGGGTFVAGTDYELIPESGQIRPIPGGSMQDGATYRATYNYFPVFESQYLNNEETNPLFDGMKLYAKDQPLEIDDSRTGWSSTSRSTLIFSIKPRSGLDKNKFPADYEIRFFSDLVTSDARKGKDYIKANFEVWDVTPGRLPVKKRIVILDAGATKDSTWTPGESVVILKDEESLKSTWEFTFNEPAEGDTILPTEGDIYFIGTTRPFTSEDVYTFTTESSKIQEEQAKVDLETICVVPNPYVATNVLEQLDRQNPRDRGPRRLYFDHLPQKCTIRIFTVSGELVDTIEHEAAMDDGKEFWDLTTRDNFPIAYGIYIFHVDAGSLGQKIGRFAVIK